MTPAKRGLSIISLSFELILFSILSDLTDNFDKMTPYQEGNMDKEIQNKAILQRKNKVGFLFLLLASVMLFFLFSVLKTISSDRRIPSDHNTIHDRSFRGAIISADDYTLSSSDKTYQAVIRGDSIEPDKKPLFVKLFSIYGGIPQEEVLAKFKDRKGRPIKGNIVLSRSINARFAMQLKALSYKLRKMDVFRSIKTKNGVEVVYGLDIIENGESRRFPLADVLSPILGYVGDSSDGKYTRPHALAEEKVWKVPTKNISRPKRTVFFRVNAMSSARSFMTKTVSKHNAWMDWICI
ncbi:MAG: hypothetical protein B7Y63_09785 [Sulfurovum sp. 35-42-20]|nr:MAG: hypothetical protein B7Y63_09785 [Sulfurovum sp. 35-42-20]